MHGRLKVRTTAEQEEAKKIERQNKLKLFTTAKEKLFEKRANKEYDEEALCVLKEFLQINPDFYTMWNYRREILLHMKEEKSEDEQQAQVATELELTQYCLKTNPKSYCAWRHRSWSMEYAPKPNWTQELKLCDLFLSMDERNFHCWDYRRLVCKKCEIDPEDELKYTTKLIQKNFSNYSSWHYRSTLLPIVHPGSTYISIKEETLLKEYDLVQNAAFTDPDDQSIWFYHRWLLGRGNRNLEILDLAVIKNVKIIAVSVSQPIEVNDENKIKLYIGEKIVDVNWLSADEEKASTVWYCQLNKDVFSEEIRVEIENKQHSIYLSTSANKSLGNKLKDCSQLFYTDISIATRDVLETELASCEQLLELEPENKWTLFTCIVLMRAINSRKYQNEVLDYLDALMETDKMRCNYYKDLRSKFIIEDYIANMASHTAELCLSNKDLYSLYHMDHFIFIKKIDLSGNNLTSIHQLCYLLSAEEIILDDNKLTSCKDIRKLTSLKCLCLKNNYIESLSALASLTTCSQLRLLFLEGCPIAKLPNYKTEITTLLEKVTLAY